MYLIDTNILIYAALNLEPIASFFNSWTEKNQLTLSVISISEFLAGATPDESQKIEPLIEKLGALPVDLAVARVAANYRRQYTSKSKTPYLLDCLLAATAKIYNLTLLTHNVQDYPMTDIKILDPFDQGQPVAKVKPPRPKAS